MWLRDSRKPVAGNTLGDLLRSLRSDARTRLNWWPRQFTESKESLLDVLDLEFKSAERLGQKVVQRGENNKEDEADDGHHDRPKEVHESDDSNLTFAENNHRNPDERVEKTQQEIESGQDLAGLQNGNTGQLFFHGWWAP